MASNMNKKTITSILHKEVIEKNIIIASTIVNNNEVWGLISDSDEILLPFIYESIVYVPKGFFIAKKNGLYGMIDKTSRIVLECQYEEMKNYPDGLLLIKEKGYYGLKNIEGKEILPCRYDNDDDLFVWVIVRRNAYCKVCHDGLYGLLDVNGLEVIPCKYESILCPEIIEKEKEEDNYWWYEDFELWVEHYFSKGLCIVKREGLFGIISNNYKENMQFKEVVPCEYDSIKLYGMWRGIRAELSRGDIKLWGLFNDKGVFLTSYLYEYIEDSINNGVRMVKRDGLYGFIDYCGNEVVQCKYEEILSANHCYFARYKGLYGILDSAGKIIVPYKYESVREFKSTYEPLFELDEITHCYYFLKGLCQVTLNGLSGLIDSNFRERIPCKYDDFIPFKYYEISDDDYYTTIPKECFFVDGLGIVVRNGLWGVINEHGDELVACKYDEIGYLENGGKRVIFRNGLCLVRKSNLEGLIDEKFQEFVPCKYDRIGYDNNGLRDFFIEGYCEIVINKRVGLMNDKGQEVIPCMYDDVGVFISGDMFISQKREGHLIFDEVKYKKIKKYYQSDKCKVLSNGKMGLVNGDGNLLIPCEFDMVVSTTNDLNVIKNGNRFGAVNDKGVMIIPCIYEYIFISSDRVCIVEKDGLYGIVTHLGQIVFPCEYEDVECHSDICFVKKNALYGVVNINGKALLSPQFESIAYSSDILIVQKDSLYGAVGKDGHEVLPCQFDEVERLNDYLLLTKRLGWGILLYTIKGEILPDSYYSYVSMFDGDYCIVKRDSYEGLIDKNGVEIIPCIYNWVGCWEDGSSPLFRNGYCKVMIEREDISEYRYINEKGEVFRLKNGEYEPCYYDWIYQIKDGLRKVEKNSTFGYIDSSDTELIPCRYQYVGDFCQGLCEVREFGICGIVNLNGEVILPCNNRRVSIFSNGICAVMKDDLFGFINSKGETILPCKLEYDDIIDYAEGLYIVERDGWYGLINVKGEEIVPCYYISISILRNGLFAVKREDLFGFIDSKGETILPCKLEYDDIFYYAEGLYIVERDGLFGLINEKGEEIIPCTYGEIDDSFEYYSKMYGKK